MSTGGRAATLQTQHEWHEAAVVAQSQPSNKEPHSTAVVDVVASPKSGLGPQSSWPNVERHECDNQIIQFRTDSDDERRGQGLGQSISGPDDTSETRPGEVVQERRWTVDNSNNHEDLQPMHSPGRLHKENFVGTVTESSADSLSGRVFQLTVQDIETVARSSHVRGEIWLTDPYNKSSPFITIPITQKMTQSFASKRPQTM